MLLKELNIINFKNIYTKEFSFCEKINCFVGDNGVGKTNILDAIHYLSLCKSSCGLSDRMCIRHGENFFLLEGNYCQNSLRNEKIIVSYKGNNKSVKRNNKEYQKLSEHIGLLPFVMVSPFDTAIINESGEERRKFLNSFISQIDNAHLNTLMRYNSLLQQRNAILRGGINQDMASVLEIIDMQLCESASLISCRRAEIIEQLAPKVAEYYKILSNEKEEVELHYKSALLENSMEDLLKKSFEKDKIMGYTTVGIQRDDIKMSIMGYPIRRYGSQGQQKSFLIALKLAQHDIIKDISEKKPILILDDIFDKLDTERVSQLINIVSKENFGQIFISDCNKLRLQTILNNIDTPKKIFEVNF